MNIKSLLVCLYNKCRNYINYFFFLFKIFNLLKIFINFFDLYILDLENGQNDSDTKEPSDETSNNKEEKKRPDIYSQFFEKRNLIKLGLLVSEPLRQLLYIWLSLKISESISGQPDAKSILGILFIIEVIDRSIADIINENIENEIEDEFNKKNEEQKEQVDKAETNLNIKEEEEKK